MRPRCSSWTTFFGRALAQRLLNERPKARPREHHAQHAGDDQELHHPRSCRTTTRIPKADRIDLLNRSVQYFRRTPSSTAPPSPARCSRDDGGGPLPEVRRTLRRGARPGPRRPLHHLSGRGEEAGRVFKSVLKLDKNFHIYIHGDRNKIERGWMSREGSSTRSSTSRSSRGVSPPRRKGRKAPRWYPSWRSWRLR